MRGRLFSTALCVGLTLGAIAFAAPAGSIGFLDEWDGAAGGFSFPVGVAVDGGGHVYVADSEKNRVQKFDESGKLIAEWGTFGSGPGQFESPEGVAVDGSGDVYVVDLGNARVQKFDPSGNFLSQWGSEGGGPGQLRAPEGIAVDGTGNVFVVDAVNDRVTKYGPDGTFLTEWGGFNTPNGIAVDSAGNVYVANSQGGDVQKFSGDGAFIAKLGAKLKFPIGVATNAADEVFVSDSGNDTVQMFTSSGKFLSGWGGSGEGPGQLSSPVALAVSPSGKIFVADAGNDRISVFGELPAPKYGKTVNVSVVSGKVLVKLPGSHKYIELTTEMQIPLGSILDTSNGRVRLTAAKGPGGGEQTADFFDGLFRILQTTHGKPITVAKLLSSLHCGGKGGKGHRPAASLARRHGRGLWGSGHGNFRTEGSHGSATVRGTIWWVQDGCDGTKFKVKRGVVTVKDFTNHKTLKLHKGQTYLAPTG